MASNLGLLDTAGLSKEQLAAYRSDGVILIRDVFDTAEIQDLANEADRALREYPQPINANNLRTRFTSHHASGEPVFEKFDPFMDLSPVAKRIVHDERILSRLLAIYGEPACLFKDKLIYKPPGASGASLHQDWISWPGFPESFITILLAIDPFTKASGATQFFMDEHQHGYLSPRDAQHHQLSQSRFSSPAVTLEMAPGDIAIFSCFTPHRSAPNTSQTSRRGYFISYNAQSDGGEQYAAHYAEFHQWMRDKTPEPQRTQLYFE